jgi:hypothetical protein
MFDFGFIIEAGFVPAFFFYNLHPERSKESSVTYRAAIQIEEDSSLRSE